MGRVLYHSTTLLSKFAHFVSFTPREEGKKQGVMGRVERRRCIKVNINYCLISSAFNLVRIILVQAVTYI